MHEAGIGFAIKIGLIGNLGALQLSSEDLEENMTAFRNAFHCTAVDTVG